MTELTREHTLELLTVAEIGHLAVVDGVLPYVTAVSYVYVNGEVGMRVAPGRRLDAIRHNPHGCLEASTYERDTGAWQSVIVEGTMRVVTEGPDAERVIAGLLAKYRPVVAGMTGRPSGFGFEKILILEPTSISGRSSGSYFTPHMRPGRL